MTTQYKWLPEQPTNEMLDAVFALEEPNTLREYEAMWQAAPKCEPLDDETILGIAHTIPNLSGDDSALIKFARELGV